MLDALRALGSEHLSASPNCHLLGSQPPGCTTALCLGFPASHLEVMGCGAWGQGPGVGFLLLQLSQGSRQSLQGPLWHQLAWPAGSLLCLCCWFSCLPCPAHRMLFYTPCPVPGSGEAQSLESRLLPGSEWRFGRRPQLSPARLSSAHAQGLHPAPCTKWAHWDGLGFGFLHAQNEGLERSGHLTPASSQWPRRAHPPG